MGFFKKRLNSVIKSIHPVLLFKMMFPRVFLWKLMLNVTTLHHQNRNILILKEFVVFFVEINQSEGSDDFMTKKAQFEVYIVSGSIFKKGKLTFERVRV